MDCSTPGFPVHHQLPELAQTHVHPVGDVIQPSHSLLFPSPPAFNLSQHQALFQWDSSSHCVAKVLEFQLQHQSFQWIFRTDFLWNWLVGSPCSLRDTQESSLIPEFKSIKSYSLWGCKELDMTEQLSISWTMLRSGTFQQIHRAANERKKKSLVLQLIDDRVACFTKLL